jgi:hypothetical protein
MSLFYIAFYIQDMDKLKEVSINIYCFSNFMFSTLVSSRNLPIETVVHIDRLRCENLITDYKITLIIYNVCIIHKSLKLLNEL